MKLAQIERAVEYHLPLWDGKDNITLQEVAESYKNQEYSIKELSIEKVSTMSTAAIDAITRKIVTQLFRMMGLDPAKYTQAFEALVMKCHATNVLTHVKNSDFGAIRDAFAKIEAM
ncbi:unnamed protein product [Clonostachys rhizophaga]|uniref:Uncharacterized protein n=1 Tax=Clonostachys rhizophaga TaxID=160324 RepID=A0A9N9VQX6_9HYPO|nr:unnamed protein product [Clonostachys rhizophaga]